MKPGMTLTPQQEQLQRAELLRNKGIICLQYFNGKNCRRSNCPYAHISEGEVRPLPDAPCLFFQQGVCLREKCKFFHGLKKDYEILKATGQTVYRPQDYMPVASPPMEEAQPQSVSSNGLNGFVPPPMQAQQSLTGSPPQLHLLSQSLASPTTTNLFVPQQVQFLPMHMFDQGCLNSSQGHQVMFTAPQQSHCQPMIGTPIPQQAMQSMSQNGMQMQQAPQFVFISGGQHAGQQGSFSYMPLQHSQAISFQSQHVPTPQYGGGFFVHSSQ
jgi:hypothetical protein